MTSKQSKRLLNSRAYKRRKLDKELQKFRETGEISDWLARRASMDDYVLNQLVPDWRVREIWYTYPPFVTMNNPRAVVTVTGIGVSNGTV